MENINFAEKSTDHNKACRNTQHAELIHPGLIQSITPLASDTVYSGIFARILYSQIVLKDIFATLKICDQGVIYLYQ